MSTLSNGINTLVDKYKTLDKGVNDYTSGEAQIVAAYSGIVSGVNQLSEGSTQLANGSETLYTSTNDVVSGVSTLYNGSVNLADGTGTFKEKTANMDTEVNDQVDRMLSDVRGDDNDTVSFVSDKNANVKAVQFVLKTQPIEMDTVEATTIIKDEKLNLWEKWIRLFEF